MSLQELAAVLPPPAEPRETRGEWAKVEAEVGTPLPADFKDYVARYGTGVVNEFLWPLNPFAANENINLVAEIRFQLETLRETRAKFPRKFTFAIFPEPGGYLPWGRSENGDVMQVKLISPRRRYHDRMLVAAAKAWKFRPAMLNGQPVTYRVRIPIILTGMP